MPDSGSGGFTYLRTGADREQVEMMTKGSLSQMRASAPAPEPESTGSSDYPEDGTIPEVREWVGDDLDRAQEAYDREDDRPNGPRKGVVEFLDELLAR